MTTATPVLMMKTVPTFFDTGISPEINIAPSHTDNKNSRNRQDTSKETEIPQAHRKKPAINIPGNKGTAITLRELPYATLDKPNLVSCFFANPTQSTGFYLISNLYYCDNISSASDVFLQPVIWNSTYGLKDILCLETARFLRAGREIFSLFYQKVTDNHSI